MKLSELAYVFSGLAISRREAKRRLHRLGAPATAEALDRLLVQFDAGQRAAIIAHWNTPENFRQSCAESVLRIFERARRELVALEIATCSPGESDPLVSTLLDGLDTLCATARTARPKGDSPVAG